MATVVYLLCAVTAATCAVLLWQAYRGSGTRLLLWSALCFACLTVNNALVAVDMVLFPDIDLFVIRNLTALLGVSLLLFGLIWESR